MKIVCSPTPTCRAATVLLLFLAAARVSGEPPSFAGSLAATSDYVFRGVSQTLGDPGLQLGANADWAAVSVFFWSSTVDFGDDLAELELDFGLSWNRDFGDGVRLTLSALRYLYVDDRASDYSEAIAELGVGDLTLVLALSPRYFGTSVRARYFRVGHRFELPNALELNVHLGYNAFAGDTPDDRVPDYFDAAVSVARVFRAITVDLTLSSTTLDAAPQATTRLVVSVVFDF